MCAVQELARHPEGPRRRFAIDHKLLRHDRALRSLVVAGPQAAAEARQYARKHKMLRLLLAELQGQADLRAAAMAEHAQV